MSEIHPKLKEFIFNKLQEIQEIDESHIEEEDNEDEYEGNDIVPSFNYSLKPKDKCFNLKKQEIKIV